MLARRSIVPARPPPRRIVRPRALPDVQVASYYVGRGIICFTFFYSFFNWWHYREARKESESEDVEK